MGISPTCGLVACSGGLAEVVHLSTAPAPATATFQMLGVGEIRNLERGTKVYRTKRSSFSGERPLVLQLSGLSTT